MNRFQQITDTADNEKLAALYRDMLDRGFGREVPINWLTSQATRPDILAGTWAFSKGMLLEGELPMIVKQMIAATIAARNDCSYCRELHGNTLAVLGVSEAVISSCVSDPALTEVMQPHRSILQFSVKVAQSPGAVGEGDIAGLRALGVTETEILEIVAFAAFCNFINTWADISCIRPEAKGGA